MHYECADCGAKLERCGCCWKWVHPREVASRNGSDVYCATCTVTVRALDGSVQLVEVR